MWEPISDGRSFAVAEDGSHFVSPSPKSSSLAPVLVSMMLPGFRSLWTTPFRWAWSRAVAISMAILRSCSVGRGPFFSRFASVSPSRYSITRKSIPSCLPMSYSAQIFG